MNEKLALSLMKIAQKEVGTIDIDNDNTGDEIIKYHRSTWMPEESNQKGYPWCAAFVCWCMTQAVEEQKLEKKDYVYLGADAKGWEKFAEKRGWGILTNTETALPGDIVTFDFRKDGKADHIGIVVEDLRKHILTVEGNTGTGDDRDGDGVFNRERKKNLIRRIIRYS